MPATIADSFAVPPDDLESAIRSRLPVLVTGPVECAATVFHAVAARSRHEPAVLEWDDAGGVVAAAAAAIAGGDVVVWIRDVDRLDRRGQMALLELATSGEGGDGAARVRVIASSTVDLFARVVDGDFDAELFYALNAIHIVVPGAAM